MVVLGGCFGIALAAFPASAHFERFYLSSRAASLGGAYTALADDPAAAVVNAAGLTQLQSPMILTSYTQPYGIADLEEHFVAVSLPTPVGVLGASWHRFGLADVTSEDMFTLAYGRDLIRTSQDASLSIGGSVDIARISYEDDAIAAKSVLTGSASVLLRPFPAIGMAYTLRNIGTPSFDWLAGAGRTQLRMTHALGFAYHWRRRAVFLFERFHEQSGVWRDALGVEVEAGHYIKLRGGLGRGDVTGGIGARVSRLNVDVGVSSHQVLGLSYHVSLGFRLTADKEGPIP
jgi:hypothetical protein